MTIRRAAGVDVSTSAGAVLTNRRVNLIQWVDDNADIANNDDLVLALNGVSITVKPQRHNTADSVDGGGVVYQIGPFSPGIRVSSLTITTIDHGSLVTIYETTSD